MTKADFIKGIKEKLGGAISATDIGYVIDAAGAVALATLKGGEEVPLPGLGHLKPVKRAARPGRNPKTGEAITIPAKKAAKFTPCKALKDALKD